MNLKSLSDEMLLAETEKAVRVERDAMSSVLYHLLEVDRRRLFSSLKFPSLFEYAVQKLMYSRHEAYNRIAAMRLLKELPEIESKINSGSVSLSTLCKAKTFFNQEHKEQNTYSKSEKLELISQLENKSTREVEKIVYALSSNPVQMTERVKAVTDTLTEYKFTADEKLNAKIVKLKGLLAHQYPNISLAELMEKLCDIGLEKMDPLNKKSAVSQKVPARGKSSSADNRYIPTPVKKIVWQRNQGKCANCGSGHALQYDHIKPVALGGISVSENLQILCRSCNQRAAIKVFGVDKIQNYLG